MRILATTFLTSIIMLVLFIFLYPIHIIEHDPRESAHASLQFFEAAIFRQDFDHAYNLTTECFKQTYTAKEFSELINSMHLLSFPTKVINVEYEPIAGRNMMVVYISASSDNDTFYYRIVTRGNAKHGYQIDGVFRGTGPYPKSPRQKIGQAREINPP